ncbi:MAG: SDR family NAD(P)-dependent oxidoreductase, partial [Hyphomicrobiales bacterium]|nr:SDR family NAD(P)-dependent oxidoreductase [Hyphomicrobiales bacterium]
MTDLAGKHALVTGGGTGIGAAIAAALSGAGARTSLVGRRAAPLAAVADGLDNAQAMVGDVVDAESFQRAHDEAVAGFGPVDILIANAGAAESATFERTDASMWQRMLSVNLTGVYTSIGAV